MPFTLQRLLRVFHAFSKLLFARRRTIAAKAMLRSGWLFGLASLVLTAAAPLVAQTNTYNLALDSSVTGSNNNGVCNYSTGSFIPYSGDYYSGLQQIPSGSTQLTFSVPTIVGADGADNGTAGLCFFNGTTFISGVNSFASPPTAPVTLTIPNGATAYAFGYNSNESNSQFMVINGPSLPPSYCSFESTTCFSNGASGSTSTGTVATGVPNALAKYTNSFTVGPSSTMVESGGYIGIGANYLGYRSSVPAPLYIYKPTTNGLGAQIELDTDPSAVGNSTAITFANGNLARAQIQVITEGFPNSGAIAFQTESQSHGPTVERMRLTGSSGYLGIGTASPGSPLEVNGNIAITPNSNGKLVFQDGSVQTTAWTPSNGISQSGNNFTIGAPNAQSSLTVNGILQVAQSTLPPPVSTQGAYLDWNTLTGSMGETDFINNQGGGPGGFAFLNTAATLTAPASLRTLMFISGGGSLGIGTTTPGADLAGLASPPSPSTPILEVAGDIAISQGGGGHVYFQDGTVQSTAWNGATFGGDYAESIDISGDRASYGAGDVLVIDTKTGGRFAKSAAPYSKLVAGIFSTKPGLIGRRIGSRPDPRDEIPLALLGIVPVKVCDENGPVAIGDFLVSSSRAGYAMRGSDPDRLSGAIIGKALGPLTSETAVIDVLLNLR